MTIDWITLPIDWYELHGWVCPFCGGEIDHIEDEDEDGYVDQSFRCVSEVGPMCGQTYLMRRYIPADEDDPNDDETVGCWIVLNIREKYHVKLPNI